MPWLRESPDDFAVLVERVANHLAYPLAFVGRDFSIKEILPSLASPIASHPVRVAFFDHRIDHKLPNIRWSSRVPVGTKRYSPKGSSGA
jgi:hypothetical protein